MRRAAAAGLAACFFLVLSVGCSPEDAARSARPAAPSEPTSRDFGAYEVHCNAIRTDELQPAIASAYGIERRADRVMLNVVILRKLGDGRATPADGAVTATVRSLTGQVRQLAMRRLVEDATVGFIGEVDLDGEEILSFDIAAAPSDGSGPFALQFKREFDDR
jgi:hypothetical protein